MRVRRKWKQAGRALAWCAAVALVTAAPSKAQVARPQPEGKPALVGEGPVIQRMNEWTVGLAGGLLEGTFIRFAAEIAKVLDDPPNLRVLPIVSYGAVGNVEDLLYLKGVDIAITQADVLDHFKRENKIANISDRVAYVMRFFLAEVHVYARPEIKRIEDLAGKNVSFNSAGSAANVTGGILFDRLGVKAQRVYINNQLALEKMRTGEISAIVHVVGKPNDLFAKFKPEPGFHFLPVSYTDAFKDYYVPVELTHDDYPELIAAGDKVETLGVSTVLAVYNWPRDSDRYRRLSRFIEQLFAKFDAFQKPPFQPKWREINLAAAVPGWKRFSAAEEVLARYKPLAAAPASGVSLIGAAPSLDALAPAPPQPDAVALFERFIEQHGPANPNRNATATEREALVQKYRTWLQSQGAR
jgi:TRAP-type uncharacterized transport system substrate-binding protein